MPARKASSQAPELPVHMPGKKSEDEDADQHSSFWHTAPKWWAVAKLWFSGAVL